ncbi:MarR family winged helix-turn-helix transcriptional regulator [Frondihabitans australicus]|uniref:MarR family transcriptional regulator n=1 Tax=Frondihabitans australicus TaxID=386892 RepID=A0A495ILT2_9MICO|nr:MarR family winged helix-turn-helix transcriptional regulator [Frondihabitans australicus]RKR76690.1 MarR family transcriptional regulator [Frondihabitans australicus]
MVDHDTLIAAVRALARASRVVERASDGLSFADYRVLAAVSSGEERASRLAARLAVGKPAISATVESLSKRGLLRRDAVEGDARATSLTVTDEGRELFERMEGRMARQLELLAERAPDPAALISSLATLGDAVEEAVAERRAKEAQA